MRATRYEALKMVAHRDGIAVFDLVQPQRQISHQKSQRRFVQNLLVRDVPPPARGAQPLFDLLL